MLIAALNKNKYEKLTPLIENIYKLDAEIAQAYNILEKSTEQGIQLLSNYYDKCREFSREFKKSVSEIISFIDSTSKKVTNT